MMNPLDDSKAVTDFCSAQGRAEDAVDA